MELEAQQERPQSMLIARKNIRTKFHDMLRAREVEKIAPELLKVENMFIEHINQENLEHSYDEIFKHFHMQYMKAIKYCYQKLKPKHVLINPKYFFDKYHSIE